MRPVVSGQNGGTGDGWAVETKDGHRDRLVAIQRMGEAHATFVRVGREFDADAAARVRIWHPPRAD